MCFHLKRLFFYYVILTHGMKVKVKDDIKLGMGIAYPPGLKKPASLPLRYLKQKTCRYVWIPVNILYYFI